MRGRAVAWTVLAVVAVLIVYGGYGRGWSWLGVNGRTATLWDWLHLLLLPLAVVILPLWLSRPTHLDRRWRLVGAALGAVFIIVVLAGYTIPWAWTGFVGNTLWDWLNLLALPVVIALVPAALELREQWSRRHSVAVLAIGVVFTALVVAGYLASWRWTGFTGNTFWDWLHLLLLPLLIPTVVVPVLAPAAMSRLETPRDETGEDDESGEDDEATMVHRTVDASRDQLD